MRGFVSVLHEFVQFHKFGPIGSGNGTPQRSTQERLKAWTLKGSSSDVLDSQVAERRTDLRSSHVGEPKGKRVEIQSPILGLQTMMEVPDDITLRNRKWQAAC